MSGQGGAAGVVDGLGMPFATGPHPTQMASNAIAVMVPFLILPLPPLSKTGLARFPFNRIESDQARPIWFVSDVGQRHVVIAGATEPVGAERDPAVAMG
jgi:hypothetical protein